MVWNGVILISVFLCICQQLKLHLVKKDGKESDCPSFQDSVTTFSNMLIAPKYFFYCRERFVI